MGQSRIVAPSGGHADVGNAGNALLGERVFGATWEFWAIRAVLVSVSSLLCYQFGPFGFRGLPAAGLGFLMAMVILLAELRLRRAEISGLMGGTVGGLLALLASLLITLVLSRTAESDSTKSFLTISILIGLVYLGVALGAMAGRSLRKASLPQLAEAPRGDTAPMKLLDTSALIDGRIADICETHFLDGVLGVPSFVLHELQLVADSGDALKRQRGRRGLEVLQRLQKMSWLEVRIVEEVLTGNTTVDQGLLQLARDTGSKIVTTDFNLNKVARVQRIAVLNVNELANAMKPAVLPGEPMRVLIVREGKESTQGVAYLEDGTMVVVDGARRLINRTIDIVVTSMHQTPAGKMIFGRIDERSELSAARITTAPITSGEATTGRA